MKISGILFLVSSVFTKKLQFAPSGPFHEKCQAGSYPEKRVLWRPKSAEINLDLAPIERWSELAKTYSKELHAAVNDVVVLADKIDAKIVPFVREKLPELAETLPQNYVDEMSSLSQGAGLPFGDIVLFNIFYEAFSACTSVVAKNGSGGVHHARNMDFGLFLGFDFKNMTWSLTEALRPSLIHLDFLKNGELQFSSASFIGYVGIFTAVKKQKFSLTINERFNIDGGWVGILEWILGKHSANWLGFLTRDLFEKCDDFRCAQDLLKTAEMVSPVYFVLASGERPLGEIIVRDREDVSQTVKIGEESDPSKSSSWFLLQTNYDPSQEPPFFDDRRHPALKCISELSSENASGENFITKEALFDVLSTKPSLNMLTVYTSLIDIQEGSIESFVRECPFPCTPW
ncbi:Oidioi.mRNA.OKI2018_I69.chr1.g1404.t1.cds [Oikopleura dioica]|uniref:Acid ceramidase n=1 Tax=Oikopleura dioica TaxID=34765 RepID=A0ABN7SMT6_OIKDI|nr:Oidioi.mRNA.OKI2018_I69.chr1.g1404.t1.cds [Oikopleura dioica]